MRTAKSDQTGRMPRLILVFAWRTNHFVGFVMRRITLRKLLRVQSVISVYSYYKCFMSLSIIVIQTNIKFLEKKKKKKKELLHGLIFDRN